MNHNENKFEDEEGQIENVTASIRAVLAESFSINVKCARENTGVRKYLFIYSPFIYVLIRD